MLKKEKVKGSKETKVTFIIPHDPEQSRVFVAGDFNDWQIEATPLVKRVNDTRSVSITLKPGRYAFRYCTEDGAWINDDDADEYESSELGSENCIVLVE